MDKKPKVSLKASVVAVGILVIPFSLGYLLLFIKATQQVEIILGIIGFMYFYSIYVLASHLFTRGVIKMKAASVFWIAFFSSIIPIIHLIVPIYLLKKGNESLKLEGK